MGDINELIHAIATAETLAGSVAKEADRFPTGDIEDVVKIHKLLTTLRIRFEQIAMAAGVLCDEAELDDRLKRAIDAIAASGRDAFRPTGRFIVFDEVGSAEWQDARASHSKVELIRLRQEARDRLVAAQEAETRYLFRVRQGSIEPDEVRRREHARERAVLTDEFLKLQVMPVEELLHFGRI